MKRTAHSVQGLGSVVLRDDAFGRDAVFNQHFFDGFCPCFGCGNGIAHFFAVAVAYDDNLLGNNQAGNQRAYLLFGKRGEFCIHFGKRNQGGVAYYVGIAGGFNDTCSGLP